MSKEKQIEFERNEISEIIAKNFKPNDEQHDPSDFEWSAHCVQMAGYRKQSEGEWVVAKTERAWNCAEYAYMHRCSVCGNEEPSQSLTPFCPHCGAKMKGGKDYV